jgi:NitT/TauT family transport system substrate-binding protein
MIEKKPGYKMLFTTGDAFGPSDNLTWVGKAEFVAKHRAVLVDFLEDNILLRRWVYDPKTRPEAVKTIARIAKQKPEDFEEWLYTNKDAYRHPQAMVDLDRYQKNIDDLHRFGLSPVTIDIKPYIDMSMAREAAARTGGS